jgi:lysozyme family protein
MDKNFDICLKWLYEHEGGLTNLKYDRGGLTNKGVTHEEYDRYRRLKGQPLRSVEFITDEESKDIYYTFYWKTLQCQLMPSGMDNVIFDMGVNNGVVGAAKAAQRVANALLKKNIAVDGHIGPISCDVIDDCPEVAFIDAFCDERLRVDRGFFNWFKFGRAWTNRVNGNKSLRIGAVRDQSKSLIDPIAKVQKPQMPAPTIIRVSFYERLVSFLANYFRRS